MIRLHHSRLQGLADDQKEPPLHRPVGGSFAPHCAVEALPGVKHTVVPVGKGLSVAYRHA